MINYKIFNWKGDLILSIQADYNMINEKGQIVFYVNDPQKTWPVAVFPDGTLIVESGAIFEKPKRFDFVNQKEELKELKKRNEHLFVDKTPGFDVGDFNEDIKRDMVKHNKRGRPEIEDGEPNKELSERLENYLGGKTPNEDKLEGGIYVKEKQAAKETLVSTGNDKLDQNAEERVINEVKTFGDDASEKELARKKKNADYAREYYRKTHQSKLLQPKLPPEMDKYIAGEVEVSEDDMKSVEVNNDSNNVQNTDDDEWLWEG